MEFKKILKDIMEDKRLNQSTLAKKIGVKQSQVSEWLSGKSKPAYDNLQSICININISGDEILGIEPYDK